MEWNADRVIGVVGIGAGVVLAAIAIGVGLGMDTRTQAELRFVQGCFVFSALALFIPAVFWAIHSDTSSARRTLVVAALSAVIGLCLVEGLRWANGRHQPSVISPPELVAPQPQTELDEVNEFICKKEELQLRQEFDFPDMLDYNIEFDKRNIAPQMVSRDESAQIDAFFLNGQARMDLRYAKVKVVNNRVEVEWIPGKIGVINTTQKYQENRKKLAMLMSSATLPADVSDALRLFDDAVEKDSVLMIESLNESLKSDPRNILENSVYGSNWYGSASGSYWTKFIPLRPRADVVSVALRKAIERSQSQAKQQ